VIAIILVVALCFDAFGDDEAEIEIEESRVPAVETVAAVRAAGLPTG
jgi:hypothetical protein